MKPLPLLPLAASTALALAASTAALGQAIILSASAPATDVIVSNPNSDASGSIPSGITGPNFRFRSSGTDTDVGQSFLVPGAGSFPLSAITVRVSEFVLAANPTLQLELFSYSGAASPNLFDNSGNRTPFTDPVPSLLGSTSAVLNAAALTGGNYLTFDVSSLGWNLTGGTRYAFILGFASQTADSNDRIRLGAQGVGSDANGFEVRRDYEFGATRSVSDLLAHEAAAATRDLTYFVQIPEPATIATLAGLGALAAACLRRRQG